MLEGLTPAPRKTLCRVKDLIDGLDEADQAILVDAINDAKTWPAKSLEKALHGRGIIIADTTITRHRNGFCSCSKI